jgi:succinyl-diaminopimelate desuccinylase
MKNELMTLLTTLINKPSISPDDAGCQDYLCTRLAHAGFRITRLPSGPVENFWAEHGESGPCLAFAGHTDVVPSGAREAWNTPPFTATQQGNKLYGRGAADMKGGLSAMVLACENFIHSNPNHHGRLGLLITSGEEGDDYQDGTPVVMEYLAAQQQKIDYCVIGEPSSQHKIADTLRIGRRGSLSAKLRVLGKQGHVAYPQQVINPIHLASRMITALTAHSWDQGNEFFPPTSLQITNFNAGTGTGNIVPAHSSIDFNFRYSAVLDANTIEQQVRRILNTISPDYELSFHLSGEPFLTQTGALITATVDSIQAELGYKPELSTSGGTSDGRFIAPFGVEVIELGPSNATIHQVNEHIDITELEPLTRIYQRIIHALLDPSPQSTE